MHLADVLAVLDRFPDLKAINWFRQADFAANQAQKTTLKLKPPYGS